MFKHHDCDHTEILVSILEKISHLTLLGEKIMSVISDFATEQNAFNDKLDSAITDITSEMQTLAQEITDLQNNGSISDDDKAALTALTTRTQGILTKLQALDTLNPPVPPTDNGSGSSTGSSSGSST
jgi:hypothetical protein